MAVGMHEYNPLERIAAGQFSWKQDLSETVNHLFFGGCRSSIPDVQWMYYHDNVLKWQLAAYSIGVIPVSVITGTFLAALSLKYLSPQLGKV